MRPSAIFFDMDDTLLDTSGGVDEAWGLACAQFAGDLGCDAEALREAIRRESREFWKDEAAVGHWRVRLEEARVECTRRALASGGWDTSRAAALATCYGEAVWERMRLFDDAVHVLEALCAAGHRLALITNGPRELQRRKIARFGLAGYFDAVVIEGEFGAGKPDARVFAHALEVTGVLPGDAWHVGDNLYADIAGAQAAGIHAVWIHRDRLELGPDAHAVPDRVIAHLREMHDHLG